MPAPAWATLPVAWIEARAELGGEPARPRAHRRDVQGDRVVEVDGPDLRVQEPDLPRSVPRRSTRASRRRAGRARRGRTLPCPRASPAASPMVRRAVKPVEMPKSMRPGASALRLASALAVTGAMRFDGISTPVPRRIVEVCTAAAAIDDEQLGVEQLRVVEPGAAVAQRLGALDDLPRVREGRQEDAVVHGHAGIIIRRGARRAESSSRRRRGGPGY